MEDDKTAFQDYRQFCNIMTSLALCCRDSYMTILAKAFSIGRAHKSSVVSGVSVSRSPLEDDEPHEFPKVTSYNEICDPIRFMELCNRVKYDNDKESEKELYEMLQSLYQNKTFVRGLMFLLKKADTETIKRFAEAYIGQDEAQYATVDIVVRRNDGLERITGNTGQYLVYTRKGDDGEAQLLKFTNQPSLVYYLMFLIARCQQKGFVDLRMNQEPFLELYRQVYDEHETTLLYKYKNLLNREDKYGNVRAGRLNEIVYDIRKHIEERFMQYDESYMPYAMTARHHLTVSADHIHFEGEARQLLQMQFV